jgi:putative oxidoreductase
VRAEPVAAPPVRAPADERPAISRWAIALGVLRLAMAGVYLGAGLTKLAGWAPMVALFAAIGAGQWLRYAIGVFELTGGVLLLSPTLAGLVALALAAMMIGATMVQIIVSRQAPLASVAALVGLIVVAWGYREGTRRLVKLARHS